MKKVKVILLLLDRVQKEVQILCRDGVGIRTLYQRLHLNPRPLVLDFTVLISLDVFSDRSQLKSTKTKLKIQKDSNLSPDILGLFTTPAPSQLEPQLTSTGILARFRWDREFLRKLSF